MQTESQDNIPAEQSLYTAAAWLDRVPEAAKVLVEKWTNRSTRLALMRPNPSTIVTVCKDKNGRFDVTAFFTIGDVWNVSADAQGVSADEAFEKISARVS